MFWKLYQFTMALAIVLLIVSIVTAQTWFIWAQKVLWWPLGFQREKIVREMQQQHVVLASVLELRGKICSAEVLQDHKWETGINDRFYYNLWFLYDWNKTWIGLISHLVLFIFIYKATFQGPKVIQITQDKCNTLPGLCTGIHILILLHHCLYLYTLFITWASFFTNYSLQHIIPWKMQYMYWTYSVLAVDNYK